MNWVFWVLVILAIIFVWFGLTALFKPTGKVATKILKDTMGVINEEEKESED